MRYQAALRPDKSIVTHAFPLNDRARKPSILGTGRITGAFFNFVAKASNSAQNLQISSRGRELSGSLQNLPTTLAERIAWQEFSADSKN
jgi:hypothetical protein